MSFGILLRQWRSARGFSQLALATEAGISARHLSFLETGRAQPSREMVHLLAGMLDVPSGDRNAWLVAAGYAPVYSDAPLAAAQFDRAQRALELILRQQEPYPALVMDAESNIIMRNGGARRIFDLFYREPERRPVNVVRTVFDPRGLRPYIANWDLVAQCTLQSVDRELAATGRAALMQLREELLAYPGVPAGWRARASAACDPPLVSLQLRKGDLSLAFFSTVTTLAAPRDPALQQIRIKSFFSADTATERFARQLAAPERVA